MTPATERDEGNGPVLGRSVGLAVAVGAAVALTTAAVLYAILAIPFYMLARATESQQALDRPFFRNGIIWTLPIGAAVGLAVGGVVGVWYARGGRLPTE